MKDTPLKKLLRQRHSNTRKLMNVFGCAYATAWKKVNDPSLLTVGDLLDMEACGVASAEELLMVIKETGNGTKN